MQKESHMLNVLFSCQICMFICMYVCMYVCTKSFLKTTTNSSCVCTHLANKADSDSDSDMWTWSRSAVVSCGPRLIYNGLFQSGKVFYGQMSPNLTFLLEITDAVSSGLKRRETFQRVISVQFKSQHLWWYEGA